MLIYLVGSPDSVHLITSKQWKCVYYSGNKQTIKTNFHWFPLKYPNFSYAALMHLHNTQMCLQMLLLCPVSKLLPRTCFAIWNRWQHATSWLTFYGSKCLLPSPVTSDSLLLVRFGASIHNSSIYKMGLSNINGKAILK